MAKEKHKKWVKEQPQQNHIKEVKKWSVEGFRNQNLAYKISIAVALILAPFLTILVVISASLAARSLNQTVNGEFEGLAGQNGLSVQRIMTSAENTADIIQD